MVRPRLPRYGDDDRDISSCHRPCGDFRGRREERRRRQRRADTRDFADRLVLARCEFADDADFAISPVDAACLMSRPG